MQLHIFQSKWPYFTALCTLLAACVLFFIHLFLSLNINPCHLPYITELLTFPPTCHIILPFAMIQKTPIFFNSKYIFQSTDFCNTLNLCCQNSKFKFGYMHYLYNLFIFFCYVSYLAAYLSILDTQSISLYLLPLLPLLPLHFFWYTYILFNTSFINPLPHYISTTFWYEERINFSCRVQ